MVMRWVISITTWKMWSSEWYILLGVAIEFPMFDEVTVRVVGRIFQINFFFHQNSCWLQGLYFNSNYGLKCQSFSTWNCFFLVPRFEYIRKQKNKGSCRWILIIIANQLTILWNIIFNDSDNEYASKIWKLNNWEIHIATNL